MIEPTSKDMTSALRKKMVPDYQTLKKVVSGLRASGYSLVLTIGSWDLLHIGHCRYLIQGRIRGDRLIVGVDSDHIVRITKGTHRPLVSEVERMEMLTYLFFVDYVVLLQKNDVGSDGTWKYGLLDIVRPDVFIAVEDSYPNHQRKEIAKRCGELVILPRQAKETSTTRLVQDAVKKILPQLIDVVERRKT